MPHMQQSPGEIYLENHGGNVRTYRSNLASGMRLGKAWYSGLSVKDREILAVDIATVLNTTWSAVKADRAIREAIAFLEGYHYEMSRS